MDIPTGYLEKLKKKRASPTKGGASERQELIQRFTDKINAERVGTTFKPASWGQVNGLVRQLKEPELYRLFGACEQGKSFSKRFFWLIKQIKK